MINFRFHLVSVVAVFLALGIGLAMGASFIDRATVESLQGRVDDLEGGFKERGERLDRYRDQTLAQDSAAAALTEPDSRATEGTLAGEAVVFVVPADLPQGALEPLVQAVTAAGATPSATLLLQSDLDPDDDTLATLRRTLRLTEVPGDTLRGELVRQLALSMAALSADPPEPTDGAATDPAGGTEGSTDGSGGADGTDPAPGDDAAADQGDDSAAAEPGSAPTGGAQGDPGADVGTDGPSDGAGSGFGPGQVPDSDQARTRLAEFAAAGLVAIDPGGAPSDATFPSVSGVRYLLVVADATVPDSDGPLVALATAYGAASAATMVVAEVEPVRAPGELAPLPAEDAPGRGDILAPLRTGPAAALVSTVDGASEPLARLSVVWTIEAQAEGRVGHYGLGADASAPFPSAAGG